MPASRARGAVIARDRVPCEQGVEQIDPRGVFVEEMRAYGLTIAARLADEAYEAYRVRARIDPTDQAVFSEPMPIFVEPSERPGFDGPVVVLVGRRTVSAGETLALALRGRDGVTVVGEPSQGAFSTVLNHFLPNGWLLGLPNEHDLSREGERFDVVGIPPDVTTPVFSQEDLDLGRDSGLEEALRILQ